MSAFDLADSLLTFEPETAQPRDLPGRYGRVVASLERLLSAVGTQAVVAGGWAVWKHGFAGRVTQDIDIVVAHEAIDSLLIAAAFAGFQVLEIRPGRWPKLVHKETGIEVDLMPEGGIPGIPSNLGPTPIAHPINYGSELGQLRYITLAGLFELKLGSYRVKDRADLVELLKRNWDHHLELTQSLSHQHPRLATRFAECVQEAKNEEEI